MTPVPVVTAGPGRGRSLAVLAAAALVLAVGLGTDPAGRLLAVVAAVLLSASAARDLALHPVLHADPEGLAVVSGLHRWAVPWPEVAGLRVVTDRRTPLLEIDLGDTVVLLSRHRLGRAPVEVMDELAALWPRDRRRDAG